MVVEPFPELPEVVAHRKLSAGKINAAKAPTGQRSCHPVQSPCGPRETDWAAAMSSTDPAVLMYSVAAIVWSREVCVKYLSVFDFASRKVFEFRVSLILEIEETVSAAAVTRQMFKSCVNTSNLTVEKPVEVTIL